MASSSALEAMSTRRTPYLSPNSRILAMYASEGTQFWFDSNKLVVVDGRRVLNHDDLAAYDSALYALLARAYAPTHRLTGDPFWMHPARVPPGPIPENTAEVC